MTEMTAGGDAPRDRGSRDSSFVNDLVSGFRSSRQTEQRGARLVFFVAIRCFASSVVGARVQACNIWSCTIGELYCTFSCGRGPVGRRRRRSL